LRSPYPVMPQEPFVPQPWPPTATEASAEDGGLLDALGLPPASPLVPSGPLLHEARVHPRLDPPRVMPCQLTLLPSRQRVPARVVSLSQGGVGLVARERLEPGTCALAEVTSSSRLFTRVLLLHMLYAVERPGGVFHLGGEFLDPLAAGEL